MIPVVILAGGLATRMRPRTETIPKSLLEVAGEPFLAHQLRYLSGQGIEKVILCVGHLAEQIEQYIGDGSNFSLQVEYSREEKCLLGTGGALRKAIPMLGKEFFILYRKAFNFKLFHDKCFHNTNSGNSFLKNIHESGNLNARTHGFSPHTLPQFGNDISRKGYSN